MDNFANTQARGILINSGASNNYIITENDVRNNTSAGILDGGSGTNKLVHSNLGYNETTSSTAISVTASPFTYTNNSGAPQLIVVDGGSVSAITIFGQTVYTATGQSFILPTGQSTTVTYTSAPTMTFGFLT